MAAATHLPLHYGVNRAICEHYALVDDCALVTNNTREFERVAGLRLENWAKNAELPPMG